MGVTPSEAASASTSQMSFTSIEPAVSVKMNKPVSNSDNAAEDLTFCFQSV